MAQKFKEQHSLKERLEESTRVMRKYPDRVPVIVLPSPHTKDPVVLDKIKYLVPCDLTIGQFVYVIRQRIHLSSQESIYLFTDKDVLLPVTQMISNTYEEHKSGDNFLYLHVSRENTFGGCGSPPTVPYGEHCRIGRTMLGELGILVTCAIETGKVIGLASFPKNETSTRTTTPFFGKFIRTSTNPSCRLERDPNGFEWVITNRYLYSDDEVTVHDGNDTKFNRT